MNDMQRDNTALPSDLNQSFRAFRPTIPALIPFPGEYEYTGWKDEQESWKTSCAIGDWSFLPKLRIEGPDALKFLSDNMVNSFASFGVGRAKHAIQCNEDGKVIAEGVLLRRGDDSFEFQSGRPHYLAYLLDKGHYRAHCRWVTGFNFQISGPNALALLEKLTTSTLRDIKFMHCKVITFDGALSPVRDCPVLAIRMGMSGEVGFELQGP
ncbi:MAG TPA: hypothetical protein VJP88_04175, partial [Caulobacteraceae bacterium]|nr:hypothetical protein [Caulobacteraceae bacterium]